MNHSLQHCCDFMRQALNDKRVYIGYQPKYRKYYINTIDPVIIHSIYRCPWCGAKLPKDLKDEYFAVLENEYNIDDPRREEDRIPKEFTTDEWWRKRGL